VIATRLISTKKSGGQAGRSLYWSADARCPATPLRRCHRYGSRARSSRQPSRLRCGIPIVRYRRADRLCSRNTRDDKYSPRLTLNGNRRASAIPASTFESGGTAYHPSQTFKPTRSLGPSPERPLRPCSARLPTLPCSQQPESRQLKCDKQKKRRASTRARKRLPHRRPPPQGTGLWPRAARALAPAGRDAPRGRGLPEKQGG